MKTIWVVRSIDRAARAAATDDAAKLCAAIEWPHTAVRVSALATLHDDDTLDAPSDLLIQCWSEESVALPAPLAKQLNDRCLISTLSIDERVRKDVHGWRPTGDVPGVALLAFCKSLPGHSVSRTRRHWSEHVPLALAVHHGAHLYIQNVVLADSSPPTAWFGIAHLQFPDRERIHQYLFRDAADVEAISTDVAKFIAEHRTVFAIERVLKA